MTLFVGPAHLGDQVSSAVAIMSDAKGHAAAPFRWIFRISDDLPSLFFARDEGDDDPHGTDVKDAGNEMILQGRHADHRHDIGPSGARHQHADGLHAPTGVLHVEHGELGARFGCDARDARGAKLEHHRSHRYSTVLQDSLDLVDFHLISFRAPHAD